MFVLHHAFFSLLMEISAGQRISLISKSAVQTFFEIASLVTARIILAKTKPLKSSPACLRHTGQRRGLNGKRH
jgi:hypothetical protein